MKEAHEKFIHSKVRMYEIFIGVLTFLAVWAYLMAACSNPGHVRKDILTTYKAKKLNERMYLWLKKELNYDSGNDAERKDNPFFNKDENEEGATQE